MDTNFQTHIPEQLDRQMKSLISEGWYSNMDEIISIALRRFLDSHKPDIIEHFIQEDIEWGLNGTE